MSNATNKLFKDLRESVEYDVEVAKLDFALELKRHMDEKELKNVDLANLLEVSKPMITKLLRGDSNVTIETMVKASRAVNGKLFLKIVRDNCTARVFESVIAKAEVAKNNVQQRNARNIKHIGAFNNQWNFLASNENMIEGYEAKSATA